MIGEHDRRAYRRVVRTYFRTREGGLQPSNFAEPAQALSLGLGDAGDDVVADVDDPGSLGRIGPVHRASQAGFKKVRQPIESVNDTLKGQLDLREHGGRTFEGVAIRVAQRILARAAGIWHNHKIGAPVTRSLVAYDH